MRLKIHKEWISLLILSIISLAIWFDGPLLIIHHQAPLIEPEKRFGLIVVIVFGWLIFDFIFAKPKKKLTKPSVVNNSSLTEAEKKLTALQNRFQGAVEFLKKTVIERQGGSAKLATLPWYMVIGTSGSGKTTMLANSGINFILSKQFKPENLNSLAPTEHCDWWVTREHVLLDIPGSYITAKEKSISNILWNNLLVLTKQYLNKTPLKGVLITLPLPELLQQSSSKINTAFVLDLKAKILSLREKFGPNLPFYLVITKLDLLPGFVEFFGESSSEEITQTWGIHLTPLRENEKLIDNIASKFNALIKRLNSQLMSKLHQERNPFSRPLIKDFPLQVERLKQLVQQFIKILAIPTLSIQGIYLTSSMQQTAKEKPALHISASSSTSLQILQTNSFPNRSYFVKQMLLQGILYSYANVKKYVNEQTPWQVRAIYASALAVVLTAIIFLGRDFERGIKQAYAIQNNLSRYQLYVQETSATQEHLKKALPLLDSLREAMARSNRPLTKLTSILTFYSNKSQQTATAIYQQALQNIVLPEIKKDLETFLKNANTKNPAQVYSVLKAYLMLNDPSHLDINNISSVLAQTTFNSFDKETVQHLSGHIVYALSANLAHIPINNALVEQTQHILTTLNSDELGFIILKNMNGNSNDSRILLGTESNVFSNTHLKNQIPEMYTARVLQSILMNDIGIAAKEAVTGNWVIGQEVTPTLTLSTVEEKLRAKYIANYIDIWESQLDNISLNAPKNLIELNSILAELTSNHSPLIELLTTIKENSTFSPLLPNSPRLRALNNLLNHGPGSTTVLQQDLVALHGLQIYIQTILSGGDIGNAALSAAKLRMQNLPQDPIAYVHQLAEKNNEPMRTWMNTFAVQAWQLIMSEAANSIQTTWNTLIYPNYAKIVLNRFPFNPTAISEVDLQAFASFLGQKGIFTRFTDEYLKPFIDISQKDWRWRVKDNEYLPFSNTLLTQLQQVEKIQRAFFPNGDNKLFVQFSLQPISLDNNLASLAINFNGEPFVFKKENSKSPHVLAWPPQNNLHATTLNFTTADKKLISNTIKGDWAWFRLVQKSTQEVKSRKELVLNFDVNGHHAKYILFSEGHLNPFLPLNLQALNLPENLRG